MRVAKGDAMMTMPSPVQRAGDESPKGLMRPY